uniref:Uncharacterized protein n=1 Tax=Micrurus lemniscatus lemniscatus TaxID=129467 RepID=A0A2D4J9V3_MICLE
MYILLKQQYLCWLGHVMRMADGRIPKDLLYGELVQGKCPRGRPQLRYKDICKRDLKALGMDINSWETLTSDCSAWRLKMQHSLLQFEEETLVWQAEAKRQSWNQRNLRAGQGRDCICPQRGNLCHSQIGLSSHTRCCFRTSLQSTIP